MYGLFAAEFGWTPDYVGTLSYLKQHFYLVSIMERRHEESAAYENAGDGTSSPSSDAPPRLLTDRNEIDALFR